MMNRRMIAGAALLLASCESPPARAPLDGARIGGAFTLTSETGQRVSDQSFGGKYLLVYFGYTYCPDVCPVDVATLMGGLKMFEAGNPQAAAKLQPLFVTIDPARDTSAVLARFTDAFHPRLIGLTGSDADIAAAAKAYAVTYRRGEEGQGGAYLMDHSRATFLMGPDGKPISLVPQDAKPAQVAATLARWVK